MIFIIDCDRLFAECLRTSILNEPEFRGEVRIFTNAVEALNALDETWPELIFTEVLLPGVDAFSMLNELISYPDTANLPVILVTNLALKLTDLKVYPIKAILNKENLEPEVIRTYVKRYTLQGASAQTH